MRNLPKEKLVKLRKCYDSGESLSQTGKLAKLKLGTVGLYFTAWNRGLKDPTEYQNHLARRKGFRDHSEYCNYRALINDPENFHGRGSPRNQEIFESKLEETAEREKELEDFRRNERPYEPPLTRSLENLRKSHPMEYTAITETIYEGRTLQEVGQENDLTGERIRQLRVNGLERLRKNLEGEEGILEYFGILGPKEAQDNEREKIDYVSSMITVKGKKGKGRAWLRKELAKKQDWRWKKRRRSNINNPAYNLGVLWLGG